EFYSYMQGTYNNTFSASFSMNLAIERTDIEDVLEKSNQNSVSFDLFIIVITGIFYILKKRY
ncbi:MAG: hypothetical protein ACFFAU_08315, partial [Candidatus Hodarchaeota archaeon]